MSLRTLLRAALALLVGATLFAAQPAAASPAAASPQTFAAQGAAAGLTAQQVSWLQTQVTSYVAKSGGRQTSLNTVDVNGRAELRIALPGEAHPRTFAGARPMSPAGPCDGGTAPGYLCLYQGQNGTGSQIPMYVCTTIDLPNWSGYGSWGDNQTTGTRSIFFTRYYGIGENIYAKANNQSYDWTPIWHVQNCGA